MEEITQYPISRNEKIYSLVFIVFSSIFVLFFVKGFLIYLVSTLLYSIPIFLYRFYYVLKMYLSNRDKISIIPKIREERSRAIRILVTFLIFLILPLILLYILPFFLWIVETLSLVSSWLLSSLIGWIIISRIENKYKGKLIRYYLLDEILDEIVVKEYGYKIMNSEIKKDKNKF